jgi:hypothetical protein
VRRSWWGLKGDAVFSREDPLPFLLDIWGTSKKALAMFAESPTTWLAEITAQKPPRVPAIMSQRAGGGSPRWAAEPVLPLIEKSSDHRDEASPRRR